MNPDTLSVECNESWQKVSCFQGFYYFSSMRKYTSCVQHQQGRFIPLFSSHLHLLNHKVRSNMDITCSAKLHWADKQNIFQFPAFIDHKMSFIWDFVWMLLYLQSFHSFLFCMGIVSVFSKYSFIISYSLQIQQAAWTHVERDHMQLWNLSIFIDCEASMDMFYPQVLIKGGPLPVRELCLLVCNQRASADNLADAASHLLI